MLSAKILAGFIANFYSWVNKNNMSVVYKPAFDHKDADAALTSNTAITAKLWQYGKNTANTANTSNTAKCKNMANTAKNVKIRQKTVKN